MIGKLTGKIDSLSETSLIVDVGGVGYLVHCSAKTLAALGATGEACTVFTDLQVSENDMRLLGFAEAAERDWCLLAPVVCLDRFVMWTADGRAPAPLWADTPLWKLVAFAFRDRVIESSDHPALRREPKW